MPTDLWVLNRGAGPPLPPPALWWVNCRGPVCWLPLLCSGHVAIYVVRRSSRWCLAGFSVRALGWRAACGIAPRDQALRANGWALLAAALDHGRGAVLAARYGRAGSCTTVDHPVAVIVVEADNAGVLSAFVFFAGIRPPSSAMWPFCAILTARAALFFWGPCSQRAHGGPFLARSRQGSCSFSWLGSTGKRWWWLRWSIAEPFSALHSFWFPRRGWPLAGARRCCRAFGALWCSAGATLSSPRSLHGGKQLFLHSRGRTIAHR